MGRSKKNLDNSRQIVTMSFHAGCLFLVFAGVTGVHLKIVDISCSLVYFSGFASDAKEIAGLTASSIEFLWRSGKCRLWML